MSDFKAKRHQIRSATPGSIQRSPDPLQLHLRGLLLRMDGKVRDKEGEKNER